MRLFVWIIGCLFVSCASTFGYAQELDADSAYTVEKEFVSFDTKSQTLDFYYICLDRKTSVQRLTRKLESEYNKLVEYDNAGIFYLANNKTPKIVCVNLANVDKEQDDSNFNALIGDLQSSTSHNIEVRFDIDSIMSLFERFPFLSEDEELLYKSVNWNFFVTSLFWSQRYHETLIAPLFWTMDMDKLRKKSNFMPRIYRGKEDVFEIGTDSKEALGVRNLNNEWKVIPITY